MSCVFYAFKYLISDFFLSSSQESYDSLHSPPLPFWDLSVYYNTRRNNETLYLQLFLFRLILTMALKCINFCVWFELLRFFFLLNLYESLEPSSSPPRQFVYTTIPIWEKLHGVSMS